MALTAPGKGGAMQKSMKRITMVCLMTLMMLAFALPAHAAKLNMTSVRIPVKLTSTLRVDGAAGTVKWSSSNNKIATVSRKGVVTGKKKGDTIVTARLANGKRFRCRVKVVSNRFEGDLDPKKIEGEDNGVSFYVKTVYYSGKQVKCRGYFFNESKRAVKRLSNYRITLYYNDRAVIADSIFTIKRSIKKNRYVDVTLTFPAKAVKSQKFDFTKMSTISTTYGGKVLYK